MTAPRTLFVIDVQKGFINDWTAHIPAAVEALQVGFERVVASRFVNPPESPYRRLIGWDRFAPGSEDTALAFDPRPDAEIFEKEIYSALSGALLADLRNRNTGRVYLSGIATDNCVLKTAVDLFEAGIEPVVLAAYCASHGGPDCHRAGLMLLRRFIGEKQVIEDPAPFGP